MSELDRARAGSYVAARRGRLGLSKEDLAEQAGIDRKTLYHLEEGKRWPRDTTRGPIEDVLGLAAGDLERVAGGEQASPELLADYMARRMGELDLDWEGLVRRAGLSASAMVEIFRTYAPDHAQALALDRALRWEPGSTRAVLSTRQAPTPAREQERLRPAGSEPLELRRLPEDEPGLETDELLEQARLLARKLERAMQQSGRPERKVRAVKRFGLAVEELQEEFGEGAG